MFHEKENKVDLKTRHRCF